MLPYLGDPDDDGDRIGIYIPEDDDDMFAVLPPDFATVVPWVLNLINR